MAKLMSKKTRETVTTSVVLGLIILFVVFFIIYPLNRVDDITTRPIPEDDEGEPIEFVMVNDPSIFIESGLNPDTMSMPTDNNINLAILYFKPDTARFEKVAGTVVLLHNIYNDRTFFLNYVEPLLNLGLAVILYDQRACGQSSGEYHTPGIYEGEDLSLLLAHLEIRDKINDPIITVGFGIGGDAALNASRSDDKIVSVIAVDPYLSPARWIDLLKKEDGLLSIPFADQVYFYWYQKTSGFPIERTGADGLLPIKTKSVIFLSPTFMQDEEVVRLKEISNNFVTLRERPTDNEATRGMITDLIQQFLATAKVE